MLHDKRPTRAHIHLDRLVANYRHAVTLGQGAMVMAVVKADAYGHGAVPAAKALQAQGCRWFGVATLGEGMELREAGITAEILVLGGVYPGEEAEAIRAGISCAVYDVAGAERLHREAMRLEERVSVHLKIETGMSRLGFEMEGFSAFCRRLSEWDGLAVRGVFSHLAEDDKADGSRTDEQASLLENAVNVLKQTTGETPQVHLGKSASLLLRKRVPGDLVRPGIMLYGCYPIASDRAAVRLEPVMELRSELTQLRRVQPGRRVSYGGAWVAERESVLGAVPIGYADGLPRLLSNTGEVLVGGHRAPVCGKVTMDWIVVDLTGIPDVREGQPVTLIGADGNERIAAEDWGAWAETIPYEIVTGVARRVPRVYHGGAA